MHVTVRIAAFLQSLVVLLLLVASASAETGPTPTEQRSAETSKQSSREKIQRGCKIEVVAPGVWRVRLGQPERFTPVAFQETPPRIDALASLPVCERLPFQPAQIGFAATDRGCMLELPFEPEEQFYGLGMNLKVFQLAGSKKTIRVSDDQGTILGDSHAPAPFYVSTRGYGVYVDTARYASFYFGNLDAVRNTSPVPKSRGFTKKSPQAPKTFTVLVTWLPSSSVSISPRPMASMSIFSPVPICESRFNATICFPAAAAFHHCGDWACGIVLLANSARQKY